MNIETTLSLILGTIGTVTGCIGAWLAIKATKQELSIIQTDCSLLSFAVVNYTLRPIPIQSIMLSHEENGKQVKIGSPPKLKGLQLPGILPPEARLDVEWDGTSQLIDVVWHDSFTLTVETQTGRKVSIKATARKNRQQESGHVRK